MRLLCSLIFLFTQLLFSQNHNSYLPPNMEEFKVYLERINQRQIDQIEGEYASKIKKVFKDRDEKVLEAIKDSNYVFDDKLKFNIQGILNTICMANPEIDTLDYRFFVKNSLIPNAACYGDGMFEVNLGLLTLLDTDDELAFVMSHEIAHKLLKHSINGITNNVKLLNSKETKQKVRDLKKVKYGQARAALSVIDELSLDILDYSKEVEAQADSLGYVLFSKTRYNKSAALTALEKLEFIDDMIFNRDIKLDTIFNFKEYPFQSYWLKESTSIFNVDNKIDEFKLASDTVKTHPEIEFRMQKLKNEFGVEQNNAMGLGVNIKEIHPIAQLRSLRYTIDLKFLDLALYQLIVKYNLGKIDSAFYCEKMAEILEVLYNAKKNHEFAKYVPHKSSLSDEKYLNTIRLFLHNLELSEIKKIGYYFCEENKANFKDQESFEKAYKFFNN